MPTLAEWRTIIADTLSVELGPPGPPASPVKSYRFPTPNVDPPCVVVFQGGPATYLETDSAVPGVSVELRLIRWSALLITGRPGDESSFDLLDEWVDLLEGALAATGSHALNATGQTPVLETVAPPRKFTYGGTDLVGAVIVTALPIPIP